MTRFTQALLVLSALFMSQAAYAGSDSGFYLGGSIGSASLDFEEENEEVGSFDFDDDDNGYKVYGGFNFGLVPLIDLAVEGGYVNFGTFAGAIGDNTADSIDASAWSAFGLAGFKLGPIGLFAKTGLIKWDVEFDTEIGDFSDSGSDPAYGLGARFQIGPLAARAEYELFDMDGVDIDYLSVGAAYTF